MATVSWASPRWRGECISTSVPSVLALHLNLCANKIYSQQSLSLPFARRLLPVHENFLLKFEVSFLYKQVFFCIISQPLWKIQIKTAQQGSGDFRLCSSLLLDSLRMDYWSSKHCLDIWALTQMHIPAYVKSIRISILLFDISLKTLQTPLMCLHVPLSY